MAAHVRTVEVPEADRQELQRRARSKGAPAREVERARIVLLAADGMPGKQIAATVGCAEPTVVTWRRRYAESGLAGLEDLPRPGKPSPLPEALRDRVLELTLTEPPTQFGATPLVLAAAGRCPRGRGDTDLARHRRADLAPLRRAAMAIGDVQVLHRSRVRGQDPRRRRALSASARARGGALRGREAAAAGPGTHRAGAPGAARAARAADLRLRPARHHHAVRRARGGHRAGHRRLHRAAPPPGVPRISPAGRRRLSAPAAARGGRQLRHPQAPSGAGLAGPASAGAAALHPDLGL